MNFLLRKMPSDGRCLFSLHMKGRAPPRSSVLFPSYEGQSFAEELCYIFCGLRGFTEKSLPPLLCELSLVSSLCLFLPFCSTLLVTTRAGEPRLVMVPCQCRSLC